MWSYQSALAQTSYSWDQIRDKFEAANPILRADAISVQEVKAQEITAYLRPNPQFTLSTDGTQIAPYQGLWKPTTGTQLSPAVSYLHERQHKRELRLESAQEGTQIATSQHQDLERSLLFNLRAAFVQTLQANLARSASRISCERPCGRYQGKTG
jgi:cobalt-zinc-cadmium efflux system outer membrane protein